MGVFRLSRYEQLLFEKFRGIIIFASATAIQPLVASTAVILWQIANSQILF